jgi:hypothetical protein
VALLLQAFAGEARGEQVTIVRVRSAWVALDERLSAELATLGFPIREVDSIEAGSTLEDVARANGAGAVVRVVEQDNAIELWVRPRKDAQTPIHQMVAVDPRRGWTVAAVSALEILRADLLDVHDEPAPSRQPTQEQIQHASEAAHRSPPSGVPWLWAHMAVGAESSPGGLGVSSELLGELRVEFSRWLDVAAFGALSPVDEQISGPEGVARVRHALVGAAADARWRWQSVTASLGVGPVVGVFTMNGQAPAPGYAGQSASIVTLGPMLRGCATLDVAPALRLRMEVGAGATAPHAVIRFAGREVADWGQPFGLLTLGLELGVLQ